MSKPSETPPDDQWDTLVHPSDSGLSEARSNAAILTEALGTLKRNGVKGRSMARETGSAFLEGYVRISIDCVNLRTTVRCRRISCSPDYLKNALLPGGNIDPSAFLAVATGATELNEVIGHGFPAEAVLAGTEDHVGRCAEIPI